MEQPSKRLRAIMDKDELTPSRPKKPKVVSKSPKTTKKGSIYGR